MQENREPISIKLSDEWSPKLAQVVGLIAIAFAQLQREIYLAAKRKADVPLVERKQVHRSDNFTKWCRHLVREHSDDGKLLSLVERAQCAAERRHDLIHAVWGRNPNGELGRWRRDSNLGLELEPLTDLLTIIRELRGEINRHTLGKD